MAEPTLFEQMGGEAGLRRVVDRFVDLVFDDVMIGFFFRRASRVRIKEFEYQMAAEHLGGPVQYRGRPLEQAHAPHPILGGQFNRRLRILQQTFQELGVPAAVAQHWLEHDERQRPLITGAAGGECLPEQAWQRAAAAREGSK